NGDDLRREFGKSGGGPNHPPRVVFMFDLNVANVIERPHRGRVVQFGAHGGFSPVGMQRPNVVIFQRGVGAKAAVVARKRMDEIVLVHIRRVGELRVGGVPVARPDVRKKKTHGLLRSIGGRNSLPFNSSGLEPTDDDEHNGCGKNRNREDPFHQRASGMKTGSCVTFGNSTRLCEALARSGTKNASKIASRLKPNGSVPHSIPSSSVGFASEGMGWAGGTSSLAHTVI